MLSSGILDFAIGMVFTFLAVSLAAGAATEALASFLKTRSTTLLQGVKDLLNESDVSTLAADLYKHALINPRGSGGANSAAENPPAYIHPDQFAAAFLDIIKGLPANERVAAPPGDPPPAQVQQDPDTRPVANPATIDFQVKDLKAKVDDRLPPGTNNQIRNVLHGIIDRAKGDEEKIRTELSSWFDNAMDRVSGAYKRWAQVWSFAFAFLIALVLNVSAIDVATSLWRQPIDTKMIGTISDLKEKTPLPTYLTDLDTMPIGWTAKLLPQIGDNATSGEVTLKWVIWSFLHLLGWAFTAFATLFGAPFWFDLLQQFVRLKGAGPSPSEKGTSAAASK